jgi:hypothetical protein
MENHLIFGGHTPNFESLRKAFLDKGIYLHICGGGKSINGLTYEIKELKKKYSIIVLALHHDYSQPLSLEVAHIFRSSKEGVNKDTVFPVHWVSMPIFSPLEKTDLPIVTFCGSMSNSSRSRGLAILSNSKELICKFDIKKMFWNGKIGDEKSHEQFIQNMKEGHFVFCPRGAGNFSIRFYEALKCGRIPVVMNTISLPFLSSIQWKDYIVLCDSEESMPKQILEFWNQRDILQSQLRCSELFQREFIDNLDKNMLSEVPI